MTKETVQISSTALSFVFFCLFIGMAVYAGYIMKFCDEEIKKIVVGDPTHCEIDYDSLQRLQISATVIMALSILACVLMIRYYFKFTFNWLLSSVSFTILSIILLGFFSWMLYIINDTKCKERSLLLVFDFSIAFLVLVSLVLCYNIYYFAKKRGLLKSLKTAFKKDNKQLPINSGLTPVDAGPRELKFKSEYGRGRI